MEVATDEEDNPVK